MSITITINDLSALDAFLSSRSFFEGVEATSADVAALAFVGSNVDAAKYPNVARWAAHIRAVQEKKKPKNAKISVAVSGGAAAAAAPAKTAAPAEEEDIDLFGEETEEEAAAKEKLKQDAAAKKEEKKGPITKSSIIFDIKPWEADQDLRSLEQKIRDSVQMEGLHWGVGMFFVFSFESGEERWSFTAAAAASIPRLSI